MKKSVILWKVCSVIGLSIIILTACNQTKDKQKKDNVTIDYSYTGVNTLTIENFSVPVKKTSSSHNHKGNRIINSSILNNPSLVSGINWQDSTKTTKIVNKSETLIEMGVISTTLQSDTFYLLDRSEKYSRFFINGKTNTNVLKLILPADSLNYEMEGTFQDTIQIANVKNENSEKKAYYVVHKILYETIRKEINTEVKKIAKR
jgi:hypothetical protein